MKHHPDPRSLSMIGRGCRGRRPRRAVLAALAAAAMVAASCSGDSEGEDAPAAAPDTPTILVTTGIWADIVSNVACDGLADIETIIPVGGDPHSYEPSLQDRARMENAALVVANGLELEEALEDTLEAVAESGTPVFEFAEGMETIPFSFEGAHHHGGGEEEGHDEDGEDEEGHDEGEEEEEEGHHDEDDDDEADEEEGHHDEDDEDEADEEEGHHDEDDDDEADEEEGHHDEDDDDEADEEEGHHDEDDDDEGDEEEGHDDEEEGHGSGGDPHVWFDPQRVSGALPSLAEVLTNVGLDAAAVEACMTSYLAELEAMDAEVAAKVEQLPAASRKLVTNHEALGYFADRYGFELIGTVIPTPASMAQASPAGLEELAEIIEHEGIKAIFAETLHSVDDVEALADRVGDVDVVTLYTGSLGPPGSGAETYVDFMRTNADLIVDALG